MIVWYLCNQCVSALNVSLNPTHSEVNSIPHYVIKIVSDLRQVGGFYGYSSFLNRHHITEILLKMVLHTIILTFQLVTYFMFQIHSFGNYIGQ